jgi:hypothetical protein
MNGCQIPYSACHIGYDLYTIVFSDGLVLEIWRAHLEWAFLVAAVGRIKNVLVVAFLSKFWVLTYA